MAKSQNLSTGTISEKGKAISCQNSTKYRRASLKSNKAEEQSLYDVSLSRWLVTGETTLNELTDIS